MVCPSTQPFGSGFGQNGSTSNFGAWSPAASTTVRCPSHADPAPSATASVITPVPIHTFRFIADLALLNDRPPWSGRFGGLYIVFPSCTLVEKMRFGESLRNHARSHLTAGVSLLLFAAIVHAATRPIPEVVNVKVFAHIENSGLDLLVRVPLAAVKDIQFPVRGEAGYLDLDALPSILPGAA